MNGHRVLVVEDDPEIRVLLFQMLTEAGHSVITADDGQQALDLLEHGVRPSLMLIDLMLPRVSGWDLLRYVQEEPELRCVPRVIITGVPRDQVRAVADAIFVKPFRPGEVLATVNSLVRPTSRPS